MTAKKPPCPEYDESIVQRLSYVPASHRDPRCPHRWTGGFFDAGRRNPDPAEGAEPALAFSYGGLGGLSTDEDLDQSEPGEPRRCSGCRKDKPSGAFDSRRDGRLMTRCRRCAARAARYRAGKRVGGIL